MPLLRGRSRSTQRKNLHELRHGKTFKRTKNKYGKRKALKQMIAIELKNERKISKKKRA
jgi:hypothetical protein